jgi:hypothetical protein
MQKSPYWYCRTVNRILLHARANGRARERRFFVTDFDKNSQPHEFAVPIYQ